MGYTTDFEGVFKLNKKLTPKLKEFLTKFSETRRMARKLPAKYGVEGEFYVDADGMAGQDKTPDIIDYNRPPSTQPGLWCDWVPTEDGLGIEWNGGEKFYNYTEWLRYIVSNFLEPKGYVLNGSVSWQGESNGDVGVLEIKNNVVKEYPGVTGIATDDDIEDMIGNVAKILGLSLSKNNKQELATYFATALNR